MGIFPDLDGDLESAINQIGHTLCDMHCRLNWDMEEQFIKIPIALDKSFNYKPRLSCGVQQGQEPTGVRRMCLSPTFSTPTPSSLYICNLYSLRKICKK